MCQTCGKPFASRRANARTCSQACRQRAYRQRLAITPPRHAALSRPEPLAFRGLVYLPELRSRLLRRQGVVPGHSKLAACMSVISACHALSSSIAPPSAATFFAMLVAEAEATSRCPDCAGLGSRPTRPAS